MTFFLRLRGWGLMDFDAFTLWSDGLQWEDSGHK